MYLTRLNGVGPACGEVPGFHLFLRSLLSISESNLASRFSITNCRLSTVLVSRHSRIARFHHSAASPYSCKVYWCHTCHIRDCCCCLFQSPALPHCSLLCLPALCGPRLQNAELGFFLPCWLMFQVTHCTFPYLLPSPPHMRFLFQSQTPNLEPGPGCWVSIPP